ncbi:MAG: hypothetical protein A2156_03225 [Deltaproteobacteria bacterium RBG_16_48_10]|nr:MAG: hypothetical protein A2156_03225 [Deltaproteobacteria bacterium RBG_16_48_10]
MKFYSELKSKWIWILGLFVVVIAVLIYQYNSQLWVQVTKVYHLFGSRRELKIFILSFGAYSPVAYILLQVMQVVVAPIPGGAIEFLGGYIFGTKAGFIYSMIGLVFGSWAAFGLAKIFEKWAVEKFVSPQTRKKFDYLIGHEGVILSFLLFLIPGFPKDALCYILGLTPMHTGIFLVISTIGRIPGTLMANLQGAKAFDEQYKTFLILLGISTLVLLVFYIYHNEIHEFIKRLKRPKT